MLIDAEHREETRVAIIAHNKLEEVNFETIEKKQLKGNIYLARVVRIEPSLQSAFLEYTKDARHGFLPFSEIHPDYYKIPAEDLPKEKEQEEQDDGSAQAGEEFSLEDVEEGDAPDSEINENNKNIPQIKNRYKIQQVIKKRQVMLVQITKEQRGNKCAALTTRLSLSGRYCVLMPNTTHKGGISRRISNQKDRKRLKKILKEIERPDSMGIIIRTAGAERTKLELKRDYEYTLRLWNTIRDLTVESIAPALIHEEANLVRRAIRDMYNKTIEEIIVTGNDGYKDAKAYMKELTPSHAKKVKLYKENNLSSLFQHYQVEKQLEDIYATTVTLQSGGTIVFNQTEALVAIDVNSGRYTNERNVNNTALKTNLEAAQEIAYQLRLRNMAGLVVIDFIDMADKADNIKVEAALQEAFLKDKSKINMGRISKFGLLEMTRQRLRPSIIEATSNICLACAGSGKISSPQVTAMLIMRAIEEQALDQCYRNLVVSVTSTIGLYLLNAKRKTLQDLEDKFHVKITIEIDDTLMPTKYKISKKDRRENADKDDEETGKTSIDNSLEEAGPKEPKESTITKSMTTNNKSKKIVPKKENTEQQDSSKSENSAKLKRKNTQRNNRRYGQNKLANKTKNSIGKTPTNSATSKRGERENVKKMKTVVAK